MPLPKTNHPIFETKLPSTEKNTLYRPMLVKDEKLLLIAKASEDEKDIFRAVKQVVNNCLIDDLNIDAFTTFDLEYMFLKIRAVSVGDVVEVIFRDHEDEEEYKFNVSIDAIELVYPENVDKIIKVTDDLALQMRYPPATLYDDAKALGYDDDVYEYIASKCIDKVYEGEEVHITDDYTPEELVEFVENLDTQSYAKMKDFIAEMPRMKYEINYTNSKGTERNIVLSTLNDFFILR